MLERAAWQHIKLQYVKNCYLQKSHTPNIQGAAYCMSNPLLLITVAAVSLLAQLAGQLAILLADSSLEAECTGGQRSFWPLGEGDFLG